MTVPKYWRANRNLFLYTLLWQLGFFVIGVAIVLLINTFINDAADYACMGTLMALLGIISTGCMQFSAINFWLAIQMGQTRRYYLLWGPLTTALLALQGWLTAFCLHKLELLLYGVLYPGYESILPVEMLFQWWAVALSVVILCIACMFYEALYIKFGRKCTTMVWVVFWGLCTLLPQAVKQYQNGRSSLMASLGGLIMTLVELLSPAMWIGVGVVVLLAMLAFNVWVFLRAEVRV